MKEGFRAYIKQELGDDFVLIACGLPATNKTETTEVIAAIKGYKILRTDLIRRDILKDEDIFDEKRASSMDKRKKVYDEMFRQAGEESKKGKGIILDATFITQDLRRRAAEVAAKNNRVFVIQQTYCPKAYSLEKISKRTKENYESNALSPMAYENNEKSFEKVDLDDLKRLSPDLRIIHLIVKTDSDNADEWYVIDRKDL